MNLETLTTREGEPCPECGDGRMSFWNDGDCSCHIRPPCFNCVGARLTCTVCGWRPEGEE